MEYTNRGRKRRRNVEVKDNMNLNDLTAIINAFKAGEKIQFGIECYTTVSDPNIKWIDVLEENDFICRLRNGYDFRIKPEPKVRPYVDSNEFIEAQKKHGMWIQNKSGRKKMMPIHISNNGDDVDTVFMLWSRGDCNMTGFSYKDILDSFVWADGTKCGVYEYEREYE